MILTKLLPSEVILKTSMRLQYVYTEDYEKVLTQKLKN